METKEINGCLGFFVGQLHPAFSQENFWFFFDTEEETEQVLKNFVNRLS